VRAPNLLEKLTLTSIMINGFVLVDKEPGFTSHDVVALARKKFQTKKIGHAGTLDPMATGLLVLGVGIGTKLINFIVEGKKSYEATIRLWASTTTDDKEGEVLEKKSVASISESEIQTNLEKFKGRIKQVPSSVSAIKVDGKRAHERVRAGEEFQIPAREVEIFKLEVKNIKRIEEFIDIDIEVQCSSGTYIRSIARDLGDNLKVGGHLIKLNRSEVAPFFLNEAKKLENSEIIPIKSGIERVLPIRVLTPEEEREIFFGRPISKSIAEIVVGILPDGEYAAVLTNKDQGGITLSFPSLVNVKE